MLALIFVGSLSFTPALSPQLTPHVVGTADTARAAAPLLQQPLNLKKTKKKVNGQWVETAVDPAKMQKTVRRTAIANIAGLSIFVGIPLLGGKSIDRESAPGCERYWFRHNIPTTFDC